MKDLFFHSSDIIKTKAIWLFGKMKFKLFVYLEYRNPKIRESAICIREIFFEFIL